MVSMEEAGAMLDAIAEELPQAFYRELNGGISLLPDVRPGAEPGLFTMGAYHIHPAMGRYIEIYFGSFERVLGDAAPETYRAQLRKTLTHEFTHHIESLAGERGLEIKDARQIAEYRARRVRKTDG